MKQDFLGRSCEKSRGACNGNNGTERNFPNGNSCSIFSKPLYKFRAFAVVFPLWNWLIQMVNAIQERYFPVLNFAYYFPKLRTSRFAYDEKQPIEDLQLSTYLPGCTFAHFLHLHFLFQISKYLRDSPPFFALSRFEHNWAFFVRCKQIKTYSLKKECIVRLNECSLR